MKHFYLRTLMFLLMSMVGRSTFAYDVEIDGIYYNLNYAEKTAEVTSGGKDSYYYGEVIIPAEITLSPGPFIPASKMANTLSENTYKVTSIGEGVFKQSGITSIIIGDNVSSGVAFQYCNHLTNVVIGKSVTDIDFYQSNNITTVTFHCKEIGNWFNTYGGRYVKEIIIGEEVTSIRGSFDYLEKVIVCNIASWCAIPFGSENSNPLWKTHHLYVDEDTEIKDLVIPDNVSSIGDFAFAGCTELRSVTFPNSLTSIGRSTFSGCTGLTNVTIPNGVTCIESSTFSKCTSLASVSLPNSITSIGMSAFSGCSGLTSVTIPNSITSIGSSAFRECTGMTSVTIGNSVTSIGSSAFHSCTGLTSITIPNSVTHIGQMAFGGCTGLTRVDYSSLEHLCSIDFETDKISSSNPLYLYSSNPLYHARHLYINGEEINDLVIPETITSIGAVTFYGCLLKHVMLKHQSPPAVSKISFSEPTRYHATLYVPAGTWESYAYDDGWYTFINIRVTMFAVGNANRPIGNSP